MPSALLSRILLTQDPRQKQVVIGHRGRFGKTMKAIADIGAVVEVTPNDEIWFSTNKDSSSYIDDRTPFRFRVDGYLLDGQIFYGLYGPVIQGPSRYLGLICNITIRIDGSDWRQERVSGANFKVGPSIVVRNHAFDFRHPEGTILAGYPVICRYGHVEVIEPQ